MNTQWALAYRNVNSSKKISLQVIDARYHTVMLFSYLETKLLWCKTVANDSVCHILNQEN